MIKLVDLERHLMHADYWYFFEAGLADAPVEGFGEGFRVEREAVGAGEHETVVVWPGPQRSQGSGGP